MLGFGIIGCGMIAKLPRQGDRRRSRGQARRPASTRSRRRPTNWPRQTGCKAYHELDDLLADPACDVVTIGTPSGAHPEPAVAAARAGKHVIVEKPLEITLRRCDADHRGLPNGGRRPLHDLPLAVPRLQPRS